MQKSRKVAAASSGSVSVWAMVHAAPHSITVQAETKLTSGTNATTVAAAGMVMEDGGKVSLRRFLADQKITSA